MTDNRPHTEILTVPAFQERGREPRFANTCLAGQEHHLAFAGPGLRPTPQ